MMAAVRGHDRRSRRRILTALIFAFASVFPALSVPHGNFSLSVEPLFGMRCGQVDEYVFLKKSNFSDDKLSELNWEIKPELYYGLKVRGGWRGFFEESYLSAGIPVRTGRMMDSDWLNIEIPDSDGGNTVRTNYSESDNHLDYDISFGFKGGYEFQIREIFRIKPAIAFEYNNIKFTAKGGTAWYGKPSSDTKKAPYYPCVPHGDSDEQNIIDFHGADVISYNRVSDCFWIGSDFSFELPHSFTIDTGFFTALYAYAISYDSHLLTGNDYADLTTGFFAAFKWNLGMTYAFNERHSVSLGASYFYMRVLRGDDYDKKSSEKIYNKSTYADGGAGAKYFDITLSYRFKIF